MAITKKTARKVTKKAPKKTARATAGKDKRPDQGELEDLLGFNLAMANAVFMRDVHAACKDLGISAKQFAILSIIANNFGISQVDIAAALMTDRATMMAIVDRLEARKLISREQSQVDRRRQHLIVTTHGTQVLRQARRAIKQSEQKLLKRFKPADAKRLLALLKQVHSPRE